MTSKTNIWMWLNTYGGKPSYYLYRWPKSSTPKIPNKLIWEWPGCKRKKSLTSFQGSKTEIWLTTARSKNKITFYALLRMEKDRIKSRSGWQTGKSHSEKFPSKHGSEKTGLMFKYPPLWAEELEHQFQKRTEKTSHADNIKYENH